MKVNINLYTEVYPVITIGYNNPNREDFSPNCKDGFNCEVPNDTLQKWVKAFLEFEKAQEEMFQYFEANESYRPNFCEFSSLDEIK